LQVDRGNISKVRNVGRVASIGDIINTSKSVFWSPGERNEVTLEYQELKRK
jgi:hypothetical protein